MEREACVCDHGFERSDLCAEIIIIIIIIIVESRTLCCIDLFFWRGGRGKSFLFLLPIEHVTAISVVENIVAVESVHPPVYIYIYIWIRHFSPPLLIS